MRSEHLMSPRRYLIKHWMFDCLSRTSREGTASHAHYPRSFAVWTPLDSSVWPRVGSVYERMLHPAASPTISISQHLSRVGSVHERMLYHAASPTISISQHLSRVVLVCPLHRSPHMTHACAACVNM